MRRMWAAGAAMLMCLALGGMPVVAQSPLAPAQTITLRMVTAPGAGLAMGELAKVIDEFTAKNPNVEVVTESVDYSALHDRIATGMADGGSVDIALVDDIWFPEFVKAGLLKDISADIPVDMKADSGQAAWDVVTYDGKQYGLPWALDQLYLYYNEDMLTNAGFSAPPTTWEELLTMAQIIKDKGIVEYPVALTWAQAEAAIAEFVAFLHGNGGRFVDEAGTPVFNSPQAVAALQWMKDALDSGLVDPASTTYLEGDVSSALVDGKTAFTLDWAYLLDMAGSNIRTALVPVFQAGKDAGIVSSTINGSMGLAVARASEHADQALAFIEYLTSKDVQKRFAAYMTPVWTSLHSDPELLAAQPVLLDMFAKQWPYAHVRPKVPYYMELSQALQTAVHDALTGTKTPQQALDEAVGIASDLSDH